MSSNVPTLEQPTLTFRFGDRQVLVDFGELLFPAIALLFSAAYYFDTRGLPERSMMYAKWLLYATVLLAIIAVFRHAVSVQSADGVSTGASGNEALEAPEESQNEGAVEEHGPSDEIEADTAAAAVDETEEADEGTMNRYFNLKTSFGLAVLTAGYMLLLNFVSFVIASGLFLAVALYMFGERDPIRLVLYSVGFPLVIWAVFIRWLLVPLP